MSRPGAWPATALFALVLPAILLARPWLSQAAPAQAQPDSGDRMVDPPGEEPAQATGLIDRARGALEAGGTVSSVLTDGAFMPVHAYPRFRDLIRDHAAAGPVTMVPASEPGEPLQVSGTVRDAAGRPLPQVVMYVYHTSAKGWYSDQGAHIGGNSGDTRHARLFAWLKTDDAGRYTIRTIRPAGYPGSDLPAHIHVHVAPPGSDRATLVTEIQFDDDPRLTPSWRGRSKQEGFVISPVTRGASGGLSVEADFKLR